MKVTLSPGAVHEYAITADGLEPYREQARELQEALTKVTDLQSQTVAVTQQREAVRQHRQGLLDSWVKSENEASVEELAKVGSRSTFSDPVAT
jgi:hypothetical protein